MCRVSIWVKLTDIPRKAPWLACASKYFPREWHFKWYPRITGPLPKGEQFTFRKCIAHLWSQTNTQAAKFQHTLKCKRELSCLRLSTLFQMDQEGRMGWSPEKLVQPKWLSTIMVATGCRWVANKRHPQVTGERCFPRPPHFHLPNTHEKWRKSVKKARAGSAEMWYPHSTPNPVASAVLLLGCSCPQLSGKWIWAWGSSSRGWEWNMAYILNLDLFCPRSQNRRTVGPLCAAFDWRFSWRPQRETLGRRFPNMVCLWAPGFQKDIE